MPGTPPTSPRFGVNRYSDADTASFSTQVNDLTDTFDLRVAMTWRYLAKSTAYTAVEGDFVYAATGVTVTLPTATAGVAVAVQGDTSVTGASPCTVSAAGGAEIRGKGLASTATSFVLGTPEATAVLVADGTNWHIVSGEQDTGWIALSLGGSMSANAGAYTPSARTVGDRGFFKGAIAQSGGNAVTGLANLPAGITRPTANVAMPASAFSGAAYQTGVYSIGSGAALIQWITANGAGGIYFLDGLSYSLS